MVLTDPVAYIINPNKLSSGNPIQLVRFVLHSVSSSIVPDPFFVFDSRLSVPNWTDYPFAGITNI